MLYNTAAFDSLGILDLYLKQSSLLDKEAKVNHKSSKEQALTKNVNTLVIDDLPVCLSAIELCLYHTEYSVVTVEGGRAGLDYLYRNFNTIDLILLDLMMPDVSGIEILTKMKADPRLRNIPVILQTASDYAEVQQCLNLGAIGCIRKPYTCQTLIDSINSLYHDVSRLKQGQ